MTAPSGPHSGGHRQIHYAGYAGMAPIPALGLTLLLSNDYSHALPRWDYSTDRLVAYFASGEHNAVLQCFVQFFAITLVLLFIAGLTEALRPSGRPAVFAAAIRPAASVVVALYLLSTMLWLMTAIGAGHHTMDATLVRFTYEASIFMWQLTQPAVALTVFATGMALRESAAFPRWTVRYSFATSLLGLPNTFLVLTDSGWLSPGGWPSLGLYALFFVWTAVLGALMTRIPAEAPTACPDPRPSVDVPS
ncbi:hypothetical protein [Streptacidiphilus sp. EB103A]|uniref:hypothetical protein n=1 Tax=Streptacidiphilus sp. EB103A TaxID=3156275 RepID=UPI0035185311